MTHVDTPHSICQVGAASCDITPPVGIYHRMWGAASHDQATGIHRPLMATALVLRPLTATGSEDDVCVLAVDHCLLWDREMTGLRQAVGGQAGVPTERILVAFSHTHAAGLMDPSRSHLPGGDLIVPYLKTLAQRLAAILCQARDMAQPATLTYGVGRCSLAAHRDFWDEQRQQFVCGFNPGGSADDTVLVVRVTDESGLLIASIVNYACHPTTLAWSNTRISPDFVGAMREVVTAETQAPCLFLQGASADLGPREGFVGSAEVADRNGRQLGHAVLAALYGLPPPRTRYQYQGPVLSGATLGVWEHVPCDQAAHEQASRWQRWQGAVDLPYRSELPSSEQTHNDRHHWQEQEQAAQSAGAAERARDCRAMIERLDRQLTKLSMLPAGPAFPLPVTLCRFGDAFWVFVEGEHYQVLQRQLRQDFPDVPLVVVTLVNGSRCMYLPPAEVYGKGIYQETIAVLAAGCLEQLTAAIRQRIAEWLLESV